MEFVNILFNYLDTVREDLYEWMIYLETFYLTKDPILAEFCPSEQLQNFFLHHMINREHLLPRNWKPLHEILNPKILNNLLLKELSNATTAQKFIASCRYLIYFLKLPDMETHIDSLLPAATTNQDSNTSTTGTTVTTSTVGASVPSSNVSGDRKRRALSPMDQPEDVIENPLIQKKSETPTQHTSQMCSSK